MLNNIVKDIPDSITLKLNAKATQLAESGRTIYNLTAGQLPFRPPQDFISEIKNELAFIKSFQYSPASGFHELKEKVLSHFSETRKIERGLLENKNVVVCNGGKHALSQVFQTILNPGDEVILFAPYWVSYPSLIKLNGATFKSVKSNILDGYIPSVDEIEELITDKTKAIVVNSPNNPSGIHYPENWMKDFAALMKKYPNVFIINDEIYYELSYFDPAPTYFYQFEPELLNRTIIVDGISKVLASTGLRVGYIIANKDIIQIISRLQGQNSSGPNSLTQRALLGYDFSDIQNYLEPIKVHLRANSKIVKDKFLKANFSTSWYQPVSAFYYFLDLSKLPKAISYSGDDIAPEFCNDLLENQGVAMVPGGDFGLKNCARMSIVLEAEPFSKALDLFIDFSKN